MAFKSKLNGKNKITVINAWDVFVFRYEAGILQCKESGLKDVGKRLRKTITMYGALILKSDVDRLYKERKELGGKGGSDACGALLWKRGK